MVLSIRRWKWQRLLPWALPISLLLAWQLAAQWGWLSSRILPEPLAVLKAAVKLTLSGELSAHVQTSTGRALCGFVLGGGLGLLFGLLNGSLKPAETLFDSTLQMIRNIPPLAWLFVSKNRTPL